MRALKLARAVVQGRIAQARGDSKAAIAQFEQAAALQDALPYMEPPYFTVTIPCVKRLRPRWCRPAGSTKPRISSGARSNGRRSYYGLSELYKARGDADAARKAEAELAKTWIGDRGLLRLSNL